MLESEMKLSERSEFFISGSAFNQILRPLFFFQFRNGDRFPHPASPSHSIQNILNIFRDFRFYFVRSIMISLLLCTNAVISSGLSGLCASMARS